MNTSRVLLTILYTLIFFGIVSCGSDSMTDSMDPNTPEAEFNFDLDGVAWIANSTEVTIDNGFIIAEALNSSGEQLKLVIDNKGVDDYNLAGNLNIASYKSSISDTEYFGTQFASQIASFDISSLDYNTKMISGSFNFDLAKSDSSGEALSISNGIFNNVPFKMGSEITGNSIISFTVNNTTFQSQIVNATSNADLIYISGSKSDLADEERFMFIFNQQFSSSGPIALNSFGPPNGRYIFDNTVYRTVASEEMTITNHDIVNQMITGTFNFEMRNEDLFSDVITVEDGTFSIQY